MYVLHRRLFELLVSSIVLSLIMVIIFTLEVIPQTQYNIAIGCIFMSGVFIVINIRQLQRCMTDVVLLPRYFKYNYGAYMVFTAINLVLAFFAPVELFSALFAFTKVFRYIYSPISYTQSAILFHMVMLFVITVVPFTLPERYKKRIEDIKIFVEMQKRDSQANQNPHQTEAAPAENN